MAAEGAERVAAFGAFLDGDAGDGGGVFGGHTGIELDGERNGFVPTEAWWKDRTGQPWTKGKPAHASIGQGEVTATPLQICMLAATVANGGKCFQPTIINHTRTFEYDADGIKQERISRFEPKLKFDLTEHGVRKADLSAMSDGMFKVVNANRGGTGTAAKSTVGISGKTGTAQKKRREMKFDPQSGKLVAFGPTIKDNLSWFMSFAPSDNPQIAVAVVVANGEAGGKVSAPIARRIIEQTLAMLAGNLKVDINPVPPEAGHFDHLDSVKFPEDKPSDATEPEEPTGDDAGEDSAADPVTEAKPPEQLVIPRAEVVTDDGSTPTPAARLRRAQFLRKQNSQTPSQGVISNP